MPPEETLPEDPDVATLHRLAATGMYLAETIAGTVAHAGIHELPSIAAAFERVGRAVRLTLLLRRKFERENAEPPAPHEGAGPTLQTHASPTEAPDPERPERPERVERVERPERPETAETLDLRPVAQPAAPVPPTTRPLSGLIDRVCDVVEARRAEPHPRHDTS